MTTPVKDLFLHPVPTQRKNGTDELIDPSASSCVQEPAQTNNMTELIESIASSSDQRAVSRKKKVIITVIIVVITVILVLVVATSVAVSLFIPKNACDRGKCKASPLASCSSVSMDSASGYYWVKTSDGHAVEVFCDTSGPCGIPGSWMKVVQLDIDNQSSTCPRSLCLDAYVKRFCKICTFAPSCSSDGFSTENVRYSKVCGKIIAYQIGTPNAFAISLNQTSKSINEIYVEGVSLTHGRPRKHIWTFAADHTENNTYIGGCPCSSHLQRTPTNPPDFVGSDYFCDTADKRGLQFGVIFTGNLLWDGTGCSFINSCCSFNNPPWFYRELPDLSTQGIEMRVCRDETQSLF